MSDLPQFFSQFRKLVPLTNQVTYLNSSFAPPCNTLIRNAIDQFLKEATESPTPKSKWQERTEQVRGLVARYIKTAPENIAFTRDTTEGLNYFIKSMDFCPGDNVVILETEHPNHAYGWLSMREAGLEVRQVKDECFADAATFAPYVDDRTRAIGISSIMFHSGQRNDIPGICAAFRPRGIHVLVDMTQQVGFAAVDVQGVSAASFSLHKGLNCPIGFACLYVEPSTLQSLRPPPIVGYGAVSNVRGDLMAPSDRIIYHSTARRYEHLNLSFIAASAAHASLTFLLDVGPEKVENYLYLLGDRLREKCDGLGIGIVGPSLRNKHSPHLYVLDLEAHWKEHLQEHGIFVQHYRLGIRVSFSFYNNLEDVDRLVEVLQKKSEAD
ncbi:pyridoxal phosphate-dependent transferase [Phyllosticta capitalensis]